MPPQFDYFKRGLPAACARTEHYWEHAGCCFAEQLENFGLPIGWGYGWEGDPDPNHQRDANIDDGTEAGKWIRYYHDSQLEFAFMILRYHAFSGRDIRQWVPFIDAYPFTPMLARGAGVVR